MSYEREPLMSPERALSILILIMGVVILVIFALRLMGEI